MSGVGPLPLEFVLSAARADQLPDNDVELAIVGRSNVGKSSLLNALANRKQLALVSKTPGRTQLLNCFALGARPPSSTAPATATPRWRRTSEPRGRR